MPQEDRRVRKTKTALYKALIEELKTRELHAITVLELCERADIHRATFYYHYADIYALYQDLEDEVCQALIHAMEGHDYEEVFRTIVEYIEEHRDVWMVLLGAHGVQSFRNRLADLLMEKYIAIILFETGRETLPDEIDFMVNMMIPGWVNIIYYWLENGRGYSQKKLVQILMDIDQAADTVIEKYLKQNPEKSN